MPLNPKLKAAWIEDLRTTDAPQVRGVMKKKIDGLDEPRQADALHRALPSKAEAWQPDTPVYGYCCLGRLREVAEGLGIHVEHPQRLSPTSPSPAEWAAWGLGPDEHYDFANKCVGWNDRARRTFKQIASYIEGSNI